MDLIEKIKAAGSDNHEVFGGLWTGGYLLQQEPKEFAELVALLHGFVIGGPGQIENYLSIGIAAGGNERFICDHVPVRRLLVIDNGMHHNYGAWNANRSAIKETGTHVIQFTGDSHSQDARDFLADMGYKFDVVGIDGDHSEAGVRADWEMVRPYLKPGALVWFHDISVDLPGNDGAGKLWTELENEYEVVLRTGGKFGIGVIRV